MAATPSPSPPATSSPTPPNHRPVLSALCVLWHALLLTVAAESSAIIESKSEFTSATRGSTSRREWISVWAVAFSVFVVTTTEMAPVGLLPEIARDFDVSAGAAGISVTAFGLVAGLLAPAATLVTSQADRRSLLIMILAVFTVGNSVAAASHTFWL